MRKNTWLAFISGSFGIFTLGPVLAQDYGPTTPAPRGLSPGILEVDVGRDPYGYTINGEPAITINPKNPNNIVITYIVIGYSPKSAVDPPLTETPSLIACAIAASFDRGHTWSAQLLQVPTGLIDTTTVPMTDGYDCAEPRPQFAPDGTLYVAAYTWVPHFLIQDNRTAAKNARHGKAQPPGFFVNDMYNDGFNMHPMWKSTDGGRTFGVPWQVIGLDRSKFLLDPKFEEADEYQALGFAEFAVDASNGRFVMSTWGGGKVDPKYGLLPNHVQVSEDSGRSWSKPVLVQSAEYPVAMPLPGRPTATIESYGQTVASNGLVAIAYASHYSPKHSCPCAVLALSEDRGRTFRRSVVPTPKHMSQWDEFDGVTGTALPMVYMALDPSNKDGIAYMVINADASKLLIYVSADRGRTWRTRSEVGLAMYPDSTKPDSWGRAPIIRMNRPRIAYGPHGELAVMWRQNYPQRDFRCALVSEARCRELIYTGGALLPSGPQDVYAAMSFNGGKTWTAPVKVNSKPSGWNDRGPHADDFSWLVVDDEAVHVGWAGYYPYRTTWYSQVPVSLFRNAAMVAGIARH